MELGRLPRVKTVANLMRKICYNNKDHLMAGLIVGGWDPYEGGQVYEIPLGGTLMRQRFSLGGSGSSFIYGLADATYKEGMTKEECQNFVKKCKFLIKNLHIVCIITNMVCFCMMQVCPTRWPATARVAA